MRANKALCLILAIAFLAGCTQRDIQGVAGPGDAQPVVAFADGHLEGAVREALGWSLDMLPVAAVDSLVSLGAPGLGIGDLRGIEALGNLEVLDLADNAIQDLGPLAALGKLTHLSLENNQVGDLSPLAALGNLQVLMLGGNQVQSLEPLLGLSSLERVELAGNRLDGQHGWLDRLRQQGVQVDLGEGVSVIAAGEDGPPAPTCAQPALIEKSNRLLQSEEDVLRLLDPLETRCLSLDGYLILGGTNRVPLASLEGLRNLLRVERDMSIMTVNRLVDLQGLENLSWVGGSLAISSNVHLQSVVGLSRLAGVGGHFFIRFNDELQRVEGLEYLTQVEGDLHIGNNRNLTSLVNFPRLTRVGGTLRISNNTTLVSLSGLEALQTVGKRIEITANPALPTWEIDWFMEQITSRGFAGETYIFNNQP